MFKKIGFKLISAVGTATIIIIFVFAYLNVQSQSKALFDEVERHVNQLSETVKNSTRYGMLLNERAHIHNIIQTIGNQPCINEVRVFNKEGEIIYSSDTTAIGHMVDKKTEACYACHAANKPLEKLEIDKRTRVYKLAPDSSRVLGIINPIYNEPSCWEAQCHAHPSERTVLGVLDVTISIKAIDNQIASTKFKMLMFAIIAIILLSGTVWYFVRSLVDKPVNTLLQATKNVAAGNLSYTIKEHSNDELGMLARSFNNMTQKLSEARMQLFQSDKLASLGRLAAGVAHEINNPLTGILTYSSFLLKRTKGNSDLQSDLEVIVRETKRSREIVKGLLDFARQSVPKKNNANINEILNHAIGVVENQLAINNVKIVKNLDLKLPRVTIDANQIEQVFINLVVNANDAIGKNGGNINVSTTLLYVPPKGYMQIKRAACPKGHSLIDNEIKIDGLPSIKLKALSNGSSGIVNLDPIYGKSRHYFGIEYSKNKTLQLMCPHCDVSLIEKNNKCPKCASSVYSFEIPTQGEFVGCTNRDCGWQNWKMIELEGKKEFIEVKISDSGCGIPKENLYRIFEPFYSTKGQRGTGLGLAVIWGIIDNHNGTITVDSNIGEGTTFTIRIPATRSAS
ncbi:MAG: ATP-binding protein [Calditrichaceae bacterium]